MAEGPLDNEEIVSAIQDFEVQREYWKLDVCNSFGQVGYWN